MTKYIIVSIYLAPNDANIHRSVISNNGLKVTHKKKPIILQLQAMELTLFNTIFSPRQRSITVSQI
ncbi:hypothetical protein O7Q_00254 [Bartonella quintana JK 39]|uniref:hypothetical protein n=1 Tax=Bartonella quintana TaxID=803 RepID=UPI00049EC858|nr:hypothetical protein [Bartonella quintana]KEC68472.1 hypothetical protein O7Q_00254 [Bartonella quintana JK 39]